MEGALHGRMLRGSKVLTHIISRVLREALRHHAETRAINASITIETHSVSNFSCTRRYMSFWQSLALTDVIQRAAPLLTPEIVQVRFFSNGSGVDSGAIHTCITLF